MTAFNQDDTFYQGTNRIFAITVKDENTGIAKSLAGATLLYRLSKSVNRPVLIEKTVGDGITLISSGTTGQLQVTFDPEDTETLAPGDYYHELSITDADGKQSVALTGNITIKKRLTLT